MEDSELARKITRNLSEIKERITVIFDPIIDFLIEKDVVPMSIKLEIDAKNSPNVKLDYLIRLLMSYGNEACDLFLQALRKNGLCDLEDKIRNTRIRERDDSLERTLTFCSEVTIDGIQTSGTRSIDLERTMTLYSEDTSLVRASFEDGGVSLRRTNTFNENMSALSFISLADQQQTIMNRLNKLEAERNEEKEIFKQEKQEESEKHEAFRKSIESQLNDEREDLRKEKEDLRKEKEIVRKERKEMRKENEEMRSESRALDSKFKALEEEFANFKLQADQDTDKKKRQIEQLTKKNSQLQRELENTRRRLRTKSCECDTLQEQIDEMNIQLDEKSVALLKMNNWINKLNAEDGKRARNTLNQTVRDSRLPRITKRGSLVGQPANKGFGKK